MVLNAMNCSKTDGIAIPAIAIPLHRSQYCITPTQHPEPELTS